MEGMERAFPDNATRPDKVAARDWYFDIIAQQEKLQICSGD